MNEMTDAERLIEARRLVLEHRRASISLSCASNWAAESRL